MTEGRSTPGQVLEVPSRSFPEESGGGLWGFVLFSSLIHAALIWTLFVIPHVPFRRVPSYPVYTVELVGGEKIGAEVLSPTVAAAPKAKKEATKIKSEPPTQVQAVKKEKKKIVVSPAEMREEVALKKSKREVKEEREAEQGVPDHVREKLIQAALERVKDRAETEQKKKKGDGMSSGAGEGEGAATLGEGGRGGGIVKGVEFLIYRNRMLYLIRERWTWVGKRSDLEVTVRFGIQETGDIVGLRIVQPSGDPSYDDSVFRAVKKATPLPPPPESYRKDFMDVELTFKPKDLRG